MSKFKQRFHEVEITFEWRLNNVFVQMKDGMKRRDTEKINVLDRGVKTD